MVRKFLWHSLGDTILGASPGDQNCVTKDVSTVA